MAEPSTADDIPRLLIFGLGYSGIRIAADRRDAGWRVSGTTRSPQKARALLDLGIEGLIFDGDAGAVPPDDAVRSALGNATHILMTAAPGRDGDPFLRRFRDQALELGQGPLQWMGYLSTTGVYGDHDGEWVDETTEPVPGLDRTKRRRKAEREWETLSGITGVPLQIFRISGIYGPGRSALDRIRSGRARSVVKEGSVFNRVHVDDIVGIVTAGMGRPDLSGAFNVSDDLPAPNWEVMRYAAGLLGTEPPPEVPFEEAGLSPMGASFFAEDRRVRNRRVREELDYTVQHPTYREGLAAILENEADSSGVTTS